MKAVLADYIRAGYGGLAFTTPEYIRCRGSILKVAQETNSRLFSWDATGTITNVHADEDEICGAQEGVFGLDGVLDAINNHINQDEVEYDGTPPHHTIWILSDVHLFFQDIEPTMVALLRNTVDRCKKMKHHIIMLGAGYKLCPEVEKAFTHIEFQLPDRSELAELLHNIADAVNLEPDDELVERICIAASGMTSVEAEDAYALSYSTTKKLEGTGRFCPDLICKEKARAVEKSGFLKFIDTQVDFDSIGGMENAIEYMDKRKNSFTKQAREFGCPTPKGVLLVGSPGTGKTLFGTCISTVLGRPMLTLDVGALFGGIVGESESNTRAMINTVEAVAPCVLLIDEIEKGLSGSQSSGKTDGGTGSRVMGKLLSWMNDKTAEVFIVATANDVTSLPPELFRKGRFDELFFASLPVESELEAIWTIQIKKYGRDPKDFDLKKLARATKGFTGAEIEQVVKDSLHTAFSKGTDISTNILLAEAKEAKPLSVISADKIEALTKWAEGRCRPASKGVSLKAKAAKTRTVE